MSTSTTLEANGGLAHVRSSEEWVDPIVGFRGEITWAKNWTGRVEADIGGFGVGSDFSWNVLGAVSYSLGEHWSLSLGWRFLDVDYRNGAYVLDAELSGPLLAVTFTF